MKKIVSLSLILAAFSILSASQSREDLATQKCGSCHLMGKITKEKLSKMVAPPYWAISKKAKEAYETKEEAIKYIVDFTLNPSQDKMLFPKEAVEKFGLMPSQKGNVTEEEIREIAEYILEEKSL